MHKALKSHLNQFVAIDIEFEYYVIGLLKEVEHDYICLEVVNDDMERRTEYIRIDAIIRFTPDAKQVNICHLQAAYTLNEET